MANASKPAASLGKRGGAGKPAPVTAPPVSSGPTTSHGLHSASNHATDTTFRPNPVGGSANPPR